MNELGGLSVVLALVILAAAILWVILPFAIFGIKGHLTNITFELREGRKTSEAILDEMKLQRGSLEQLNGLLSQAIRRPAAPPPVPPVPGAPRI
jgi:hypothetical protein